MFKNTVGVSLLIFSCLNVCTFYTSYFIQYSTHLTLHMLKRTLHTLLLKYRAQTKTNFAAIKLFETQKENEYQQTKRVIR